MYFDLTTPKGLEITPSDKKKTRKEQEKERKESGGKNDRYFPNFCHHLLNLNL